MSFHRNEVDLKSKQLDVVDVRFLNERNIHANGLGQFRRHDVLIFVDI